MFNFWRGLIQLKITSVIFSLNLDRYKFGLTFTIEILTGVTNSGLTVVGVGVYLTKKSPCLPGLPSESQILMRVWGYFGGIRGADFRFGWERDGEAEI